MCLICIYVCKYDENIGLLDDCEVVLVSAGAQELHASTPWLAMNFHLHKERTKLASLLRVRGYPTMVLLDKDRHVLKRVGLETLDRFDEIGPEARHGLEQVSDAVEALLPYAGQAQMHDVEKYRK